MLDTVYHRLYKETARDICVALNKQQFFGVVRKGHYLSIFKELITRMVQQNTWVVSLFNEKVGDVNIYSVILVTNSYGESWDSSCEK